MHLIYTPTNYSSQDICCPNCVWQGLWREASTERLSLTQGTEMYCPECETYLGLLQEEEE